MGASNRVNSASPAQAPPPSADSAPVATSSSRARPLPGSIEGNQRWCAIGCPLTKPLVADGSRSVTTASASRRSAAASVAPNIAPASIRGAGPYGCGRVWWIEPSFFG